MPVSPPEPGPAPAGSHPCPLCGFASSLFFAEPERRYLRCERCRLVHLDRLQLPSRAEEQEQYDLHENDPADLRYRKFLSRLFKPLQEQLQPHSQGLDVGCGPGPTLSVMFEEAGHTMQVYDPIYANDASVFRKSYDFITASEVLEHLHHPARDLARIWSALNDGGWLGVMTKRVRNAEAFADWHYRADPTHVSFYSRDTFAWLARQWNAQWLLVGDDVALFQKAGHPG
ncbi:class I SAM-dependent methyltransferase [Lignipirellula cremea]|uniref:Methyltransferase domain protein n=1 Tax=Lignipirellula cremea TaxID=2528010 RepID=A0A518E4I1_9BACT|nr:class I SAM-dependent methyltransferase [Lignipirellula cremea]QDU98968.1 Methyltransferase domain protein [Lignipirellula cremea]